MATITDGDAGTGAITAGVVATTAAGTSTTATAATGIDPLTRDISQLRATRPA